MTDLMRKQKCADLFLNILYYFKPVIVYMMSVIDNK